MLKKLILITGAIAAILLGPFPVCVSAQTPPQAAVAAHITVPIGTLISARLTSALSSSTAHTSDLVTMEAVDDVRVDGAVVISRGALIIGRVVKAKGAGHAGKGGKLGIALETVKAVDGSQIPLQAAIDRKGNGGFGAGSAVGMVATGLLFLPASPLWLLKRGHDVEIPMGTLSTAITAAMGIVDASKYERPSLTVPTVAEIAAPPQPIRVVISREKPEALEAPVQPESLGDIARRYRQQKQAEK